MSHFMRFLSKSARSVEDDHSSTRVPTGLSRRQMLGGLIGMGGLGLAGGAVYAGRIEPVWTQVTHRIMPLPGLGAGLVGARIIQISDLHVGSGVPQEYLDKWVGWISAQQADWVVVTGDCSQYGNTAWTGSMARLIGSLRARERVLVASGNHDWGSSRPGGGFPSLAQRTADALAGQGVRVLRNQAVTYQRNGAELHIVGLDDYWSQQFDPATAFRKLPAASPTIVLSHNPDSFLDLQDWPGDWVLSGHTHGGQVNIPFYGPPILPVQHKEFIAGHYTRGGKNLYVNRGLGWLRRVRFNARPEVTVFTLQRV